MFLRLRSCYALQKIEKPCCAHLLCKLTAYLQADALTTAELDRYRQTITEKLQEVSAQIGRPVLHHFSPEDLQRAGEAFYMPSNYFI